MNRVCFFGYKYLFFILLFFFFFPFVKPVNALQTYPNYPVAWCYPSPGYICPDGLSVINISTLIVANTFAEPGEAILESYVYDGESWKSSPGTGPDCYGSGPPEASCIEVTKKYSEAKDYAIAVAWKYRDASGQIKTKVQTSYLSVYELAEHKNFGTKTLTYPNKIEDTMLIAASKKYIGYVEQWDGPSTGNNTGTPYPERINIYGHEFYNGWVYYAPESNSHIGTIGTNQGNFSSSYLFGGLFNYPLALPTQLTYQLHAPTFIPEEGNGSYVNFNFDNLWLFSRSNPRNEPTVPSLHSIYGYVRDETTKVGVSGATIRINKKLSSSGSSIFVGSTTTNSSGYWTFDLSDSSFYEIQAIEINNSTLCTSDGSNPTYPIGATNIGANQVNWINPPTNAGPITFYDRCPNLPTPTPLPPGSHCASYELGSGHTGLTNVYEKYTTFTVPQNNSIIDEVGVKAGVYGGATDRRITCKVTNNSGQDISVAKSSLQMRDGDGVAGWHTIDFSDDTFTLQASTTYRLYCKGPESWESIFWVWDGPLASNIKDYWVDHCTVIPTPTPTPTVVPKAWFQVNNLDVYSNGNVTSKVPTSATNPYLINDTLGGIAFSGGSLDLGAAQDHISPNSNWQIENYPVSISAYSFKNVWSWAGLTTTNDVPHHYCPTSYDASCNADAANKTLSELPSGVYFTTEALDIDTTQAITGGKKILIIIGTSTSSPKDLTISKPITVDATSTLGIIVSGNILIDKTVDEVDGVYYSFDDIHTGVSDASSRVQLTVNGNLMAPSGKIYLERDLGNATNLTTPAEIISPDAKYFVAFSSVLSKKKITWKEINP